MDKARLITGADYMHSIGFTGKGIGIAILDTGISPSYDFTKPYNRIMVFKDFVSDIPNCYDNNGHGTHVSGIACGNGYISRGKYCGMAPDAHIISLKILDNKGQGNAATALKAVEWIIDNHRKYNIKVVNLSVGTSEKNTNSALLKAIYKAWDMGICIVVADGNAGSGNSSIASMGNEKKIITVGNINTPTYNCDIRAPGNDICSCMSPNYSFRFHGRSRTKIVNENYIMMSGTSMSTPMVSGAAALLLQYNPLLSPDEIKSILISSSGINHLLNLNGIITTNN